MRLLPREAAATYFNRIYPGWVYSDSNDKGDAMSETVTYSVQGIHCAHCGLSIREEVSEVEGVESVDVDLETKVVSIRGRGLSDEKLRTAIQEAGYEAA
jgi:copper chaperone